MSKVLVIGPGTHLHQRLYVNEPKGPLFSDNFDEVVTLDIESRVNPTYVGSINTDLPAALRDGSCDEVHAYEVLNLCSNFFQVWRNIWEILKPEGYAVCTTPWWQSVWAWQDPATQHVYSPEKLLYLDQNFYNLEIASPYNLSVWPKPYCFQVLRAAQTGTDPLKAGFQFVLQKVVA